MMRVLQWLLFGHVHKWKTLEQRILKQIDTQSTGTRYIQQCEGCGKIVKRDLI